MTQTPRILFLGDLNSYARGFAKIAAFEALGCKVRGLSSVLIGGEERGSVPALFIEKVAWKLGLPLDKADVQEQMLATLRTWTPHVVWIDKGVMIRPRTLREARRLAPSAVLVSSAYDDMFARRNRGQYYAWGLKYYDIVFTNKSFNANCDELPAIGARRVVMIDNSYIESQHYPIIVTKEERERLGADVGFIGTFEYERFGSMLYLAKKGIPVRVWGNDWNSKVNLHPNLRVEGKPLVNTKDDLLYTKGICSTRINLGFLRKMNRDRQTTRSIEIPACEGFMLAERTDEHLRLFAEGKEAEFFGSNEELLEKVRYYLDHETERAAIAAAGRKRCIEGGYGDMSRTRFELLTAMALIDTLLNQ
jgi:spore maturation protein CgeB